LLQQSNNNPNNYPNKRRQTSKWKPQKIRNTNTSPKRRRSSGGRTHSKSENEP